MENKLIGDLCDKIVREIKKSGMVLYIMAIGIGMLFNYQKYMRFGINIFDYADIFDFLVAPFSDIKIILFVLGSAMLIYFTFRIDVYWQTKKPKSYSKINLGLDKKSWFLTYRYIILMVSLFGYLFFSAEIYSLVEQKRINGQKSIRIRLIDDEILTGKFIGKTKEVLFIANDGKVNAIPITALVKEIKIQ